ncbi:hypothetical protein SESBI_28553 [Sesbania bispinosa]|nr:hypothetical protein SESBI_28553 [Sesbania bispinosa]
MENNGAHTRDGVYTVKPGYHIARKELGEHQPLESSPYSSSPDIWNTIWRACNNALPVKRKGSEVANFVVMARSRDSLPLSWVSSPPPWLRSILKQGLMVGANPSYSRSGDVSNENFVLRIQGKALLVSI